MSGKLNDSQRVRIAAVCTCAAFLFLVVFSIVAYNGKRKGEEDLIETGSFYASYDLTVSESDDLESEEGIPEGEEISSEVSSEVSSETVSSVVESEMSEDMKKNKNENIINPDYKSAYYIVVYKESQTLTVYQKDKNGGYTKTFGTLKCSTGDPEASPTEEGVYKIEKKQTWTKFENGNYGRFCCLISEKSGYYISSVPYNKKKVSTMIDSAYDDLGKPTSSGNIQLCLRDAQWLYVNIPTGTQVSVVNKEGPEGKSIPKRKTASKYSGWDPTDKSSAGNPYYPTQTTRTTTTTAAPESAVG